MSYVEIKNLSFRYQQKEVFSQLNLQVERGEIFCLVGPNGCGKTTLQSCVLNLAAPCEGEILVDGKALASYKEKDLAGKMAFVPQKHNPTFPYQVVDVVAMGSLRTRGLFGGHEGASRQRALEILKELGMEDLWNRPYTALSGGQMQMVMIARALCQDSEMMVLDEPTAHLDLGKSIDILEIIGEINKAKGTTIFMATHDFNQPLYFEDQGNPVRMALMHEGRISKIDTPAALLNSGAPELLYGVKSQVLQVEGKTSHHFLATWKEREDLE